MNDKKILIKLNDKEIELSTTEVTGRDILAKDTKQEPRKLYIVGEPDKLVEDNSTVPVKNGDCFITIPISALQDGAIDISECAKHDCQPPKGQSEYKIQIDGEKYIAKRSHALGKEILAMVDKAWQDFGLQQKFKNGERKIVEPEDEVNFATKGVERFETVPKQAQQG